jgi:DNA-binding XRE family transcriptional regulator
MADLKSNIALKKIRVEILQMSQRQLAHAIGIRHATIADWERGKTLSPSLTFEQIKALDKLLAAKGKRLSDIE